MSINDNTASLKPLDLNQTDQCDHHQPHRVIQSDTGLKWHRMLRGSGRNGGPETAGHSDSY